MISVLNSTVYTNTASGVGGGIWNNTAGAAANVIRRTPLSPPTTTRPAACSTATGRPCTLGHNLIGDGTCITPGVGDLPNTDPQLGPLAANGGRLALRRRWAARPSTPVTTAAARPLTCAATRAHRRRLRHRRRRNRLCALAALYGQQHRNGGIKTCGRQTLDITCARVWARPAACWRTTPRRPHHLVCGMAANGSGERAGRTKRHDAGDGNPGGPARRPRSCSRALTSTGLSGSPTIPAARDRNWQRTRKPRCWFWVGRAGTPGAHRRSCRADLRRRIRRLLCQPAVWRVAGGVGFWRKQRDPQPRRAGRAAERTDGAICAGRAAAPALLGEAIG